MGVHRGDRVSQWAVDCGVGFDKPELGGPERMGRADLRRENALIRSDLDNSSLARGLVRQCGAEVAFLSATHCAQGEFGHVRRHGPVKLSELEIGWIDRSIKESAVRAAAIGEVSLCGKDVGIPKPEQFVEGKGFSTWDALNSVGQEAGGSAGGA